MPDPILSLCIPTYERREWIRKCLAACIPQVEALPAGQVEIVVSDNASPDGTWEVLQAVAADHACLRIHRNPENNYTANFNTVVQQARGRYAWLMGDDDAPLPGAVARMLAEVQEHPRDLYLMHALEADIADRPLERRSWFRDLPRIDWDLRDDDQCREFLDRANYMAGAFGFISILAFDREAWLEGLEASEPFARIGWPHVAMGLQLARRRGRVRVLPDTLVFNRVNDNGAETDLFGRIMHDLRAWVRLADRFFGDKPDLRRAFVGVLRRNTSEDTIKALRAKAPSLAAWEEARGLLLSAYHAPQTITQVELAHQLLQLGQRSPSRTLDPDRLCVADLGFLARGARRTAVLVRDPGAAPAAGLIAAFQAHSRARIRVYGPGPARIPSAPGLDYCGFDLERFVADPASRGPVQADLQTFAPDLVVNADPDRHPALDLLAGTCRPVGAVALAAPRRDLKPEVRAWLDSAYPWLLPSGAPEALAQALGLGAEYRLPPGAVIEPSGPPPVASQAFLFEPDWSAQDWIEVLLSYLDAFRPGEPVALILFLGRDKGDLNVDLATRRVLEVVGATGRQTFPDVLVLDDLVDLANVLQEYPVHSRLRPGPGDLTGLVGPFGARFGQSRARLAQART
jgi:glycosyltransferase involved in cell wall biosynthesis